MNNEFEKENTVNNEEVESAEIEEVKADKTEANIEVNEEVTTKKEKKKSVKREILEWVAAIVIAVVVALVIRTFFFNLVTVSGGSMDNTLQDGQKLVVYRFNYTPEQGDIVVFTPDMHPDTPYIKRVIATEGQTVDIDERGIVYVDDKVLDEPYIKNTTILNGDVEFPITVPEDCVFVMGDNRQGSHDGRSLDVSSIKEKPGAGDEKTTVKIHNDNGTLSVRQEYLYYGCVHEDDIMGKAVLRFWPFGEFGGLY
ncbi:MAG: signal peptidase I [Clostridia bacterium]|nr:signal peptidase I [Clostridia bacterium]